MEILVTAALGVAVLIIIWMGQGRPTEPNETVGTHNLPEHLELPIQPTTGLVEPRKPRGRLSQ